MYVCTHKFLLLNEHIYMSLGDLHTHVPEKFTYFEREYSFFYRSVLQKRPVILRSLLIAKIWHTHVSEWFIHTCRGHICMSLNDSHTHLYVTYICLHIYMSLNDLHTHVEDTYIYIWMIYTHIYMWMIHTHLYIWHFYVYSVHIYKSLNEHIHMSLGDSYPLLWMIYTHMSLNIFFIYIYNLFYRSVLQKRPVILMIHAHM